MVFVRYLGLVAAVVLAVGGIIAAVPRGECGSAVQPYETSNACIEALGPFQSLAVWLLVPSALIVVVAIGLIIFRDKRPL